MIFLSAFLLPYHNESDISGSNFQMSLLIYDFSISFKHNLKMLFQLIASFYGFTNIFSY